MLDWSAYDAERLRKAGGAPGLTPGQRTALEAFLVRALGVSSPAAGCTWGDVIGYGLDAIAVVHVRPGISHAHAAAGFPVAAKVYRKRQPRLIAWHASQFHRTPRLPGNPRVQQSVTAGEASDGRQRRSFAVVQYVPGVLLASWLAAHAPPPSARAAALLRDVFELVIGLWSAGLRPWDIRPDNLVLDEATGRLTWIDTDACHQIFEEVTQRPDDWSVRDAVEERYLRRTPVNVIVRIQLGRKPGTFGSDGRMVRRAADALADSGLYDAMHALGRPGAPPDAEQNARAAVDPFLRLLAAS